MIGSLPNFFIRSKSYTYFSMFYFGMCYQIFHSRNNFGYTGFIICSQQSCTIGYYNILTFILQYFRIFVCFKNYGFFFI